MRHLFLLLLVPLCFGTAAPEPNLARPGKDYALFFAVDNYAKMNDLQNPVQNARDVAALLKSEYGFATEVVTNPTYDQIETKIAAYQTAFQQGTKDRKGQLFIFFSGHGMKDYGDGYFVPSDGDPARPHRTALPYGFLRGEIDKIDCQHIMVMVDACHSATFNPDWKNKPNTRYGRPGEQYVDQTLQNHAQHRARLFITSDAVGEQTPDRSALTRQLLEGLGSYRSTSNYLTSSILASNYLERANPAPGGGEFGSDRSAGASCFLFFREVGGPIVPPAEQRAWDLAVEGKDASGYLFYQRLYPDGTYAAEATEALKALGYWAQPETPNRVQLGGPVVSTRNIRPVNVPDNMVFIKGGTFQMGDVFGDGGNDEKPVHAVTVSDFYLSRTELTFAEYDRFCEATGHDLPDDAGSGRDQRPAINISWYDAVAYCNWWSEQSGYTPVYRISGENVTANWNANGYRLPTEAEWEYAARSWGKKEKWAGTSTESSLSQFANFYGKEDGYEKTFPVGSLRANNLGLADMSGNVYEWCWDWYDSDYYGKSPANNPRGAGSGTYRVIRGGGWLNGPSSCRAAYRGSVGPTRRYDFFGFRLARSF